MDLRTPLAALGIKYKTQSKKLEKLGITSIEDLLFYVPVRYEDLSLISKIERVQPGEMVTIQGTVVNTERVYTRRNFTLQKIYVQDETGMIGCIWFNQPYILQTIKKGDTVSIAGRIEQSGRIKNLVVKEYEVLNDSHDTTHTGRLVPIYSETRGLSSKWLRNRVKELLREYIQYINEHLPQDIVKKHSLLSLSDSLHAIHFPSDIESAENARYRLSFDELLLTQLAALLRKKEWEEQTVTVPLEIDSHKEKIKELIKSLPFELTNSQKTALEDIFSDLSHTKPMNRLVQGDVGSGKTIVAAISFYLAFLNGYQGAYMAPTEILANQHYETLSRFLTPFGINVLLYTSASKKKIKEISPFNVVVGTHALLDDKLLFENLGLVVIDEQQRFGVEQRAILREKGTAPHFLTMTATPIPRTIFLTLYGDLNLSYLSDMPKGRQKIKTWLVPNVKRDSAYEWIKKQIKENKDQVFIVCPFIEESENMQTVKAATKEYERLKNDVFPEFSVGLLHGKMKSKEKDSVLSDFRDKKYDILVSTPVVEVGVDVPNATIMVIEGSERFGLAQLHQLRGRVGRGTKQSYCLLFSEQASPETATRLKSLETIHNGAELAELDLQLRGPGEMFGTRQHGVPFLKIASFSNFPLIETTKKEADSLINSLNDLPLLQEKVKSTIISKISPD